MRILVTGASGLIGRAACTRFIADGHTVVRAVRGPGGDPGGETLRWDPRAGTIDTAALEGIDAVLHLAGAGIGDKRWSDSYRREIMESRTLGTTLIAESIASLSRRPSVLLSASAIGIYGDRGDETLDEASARGEGFLADVCAAWEAATAPAERAGIRTVHLRTGIVLGREAPALKKQLPLFRLGLGGKFGNGRQWQSWISIDDEIGAIAHLLSSKVSGAVNLTAPNPVTNAEFTRTLAAVLKRPAVLPIPSFGPKLLLGSDLADALLFTGQRVMPSALQRDGYAFAHPTLDVALRAILAK